MRSISGPEVLISGRRLGLSLMAAIYSATAAGIITYYGLEKTTGRQLGSALPQVITFVVYAALVTVLCYAFRPPGRPPIALRFTGVRDMAFAAGTTVVLIAACTLVYVLLGRYFGDFVHLLAQLTAVATDAKRLQGQSSSAWLIR